MVKTIQNILLVTSLFLFINGCSKNKNSETNNNTHNEEVSKKKKKGTVSDAW